MTRTARWAPAGIAGAVPLAALLLSGLIGSDAPTRPDLDDMAAVARGRAVYAAHCASCHGANLEGQADWRKRLPNGRLPAPPHDASGHTWHHSDRQLFEMIKNGTAVTLPGYETDMPAYGGKLTDADIRAVIAFIKSTWPAEIRQRQQRMSRPARAEPG